MNVIVSDSSILIEFSKHNILHKMFDLELKFAVPDLLFHEELIDLGSYCRQDLLGFGLRVESLDAGGVEVALAYQTERPALSLVDSFAITLAGCQGWHLLTEDRTMRAFAESKGIAHLDTLWVVNRMLHVGVLSANQVVAVFKAMRDDPRCPVPRPELAASIRRLGD